MIEVSPEGPYQTGSFITLTCTTVDDTREIEWQGDSLDNSRAMIEGVRVMSTLTLSNLMESDAGEYRCVVGTVRKSVNVEVFTPTTGWSVVVVMPVDGWTHTCLRGIFLLEKLVGGRRGKDEGELIFSILVASC